ncbi:MAG: hypothetical protein Q9175_005959 [Cornicularia normoerica]
MSSHDLEPFNIRMSNMWNPQRASVTFHVPRPSTPEAETSVSNTSSSQAAVYKCTCEALPLNQPRGGKTSMFPKLGKPAAARFNDALDGGSKRKQAVAGKAPLRAKKGIAVKKAPLKKRSKRIGWVETSSKGEEEHEESVDAAQQALSVAEGRRTKALATQSNQRLTRSRRLRGASKLAAGARTGSEEEDEPTMPFPPNAPPDASSDSTLALTVRHSSEVPSTPPASGAAMIIDTEEPGWTTIIISVAPDGSSSVDYWSYRTDTWCTIPLSALRSTLPRVF